MSTSKFNFLKDIGTSRYDWKVKVRIIRLWRGKAQNGEEFQSFNILLLDEKKCRLHAFVPPKIAETNFKKIHVGKVHIITNFTVKEYKPDDKFRCVRSNHQIVFTTYTEIELSNEDDLMIPNNIFDFYELEDLDGIANDNTYLTDVIGVLDKDMPLRRLTNRLGITQSQVKFEIYDGRCNKTVTFWDSLAEEFERQLSVVKEFPVIVIIGSAKINSWTGSSNTTTIDIGNVTATMFYLNYDYHSVTQLRKMFTTPKFSKHDFSSQIPTQCDQFNIEQVKQAGEDYAEKEVICEVKVSHVQDTWGWFFYVCTSCSKDIDLIDDVFTCKRCNRTLSYPDQKFRFCVEAEDHSGNIKLQLTDREVSTFIGKNVFDILEEEQNSDTFPQILKSFENKFFVVKILIRSYNIVKESDNYYVTDMYLNKMVDEHLPEGMTQDSSTSYHLSGMSQLNFETPDVSIKKKGRKLKKGVNKDQHA